MHGEGVTYFLLFFCRAGRGGEFLCILQKKIFVLLFTHDNSIFWIPDEMEFGVSD